MDRLQGLFHNRILLAAVLAWTTAQVLKAVLYAILNRRFDWRRLFGDGGMPSAHSATVTATATACGLVCGLDSGAFAVSLILAFITCHDAMNSRQEIGKQAVVLKELAKNMEPETELEIALKEFVGHTPRQVIVGIALGLIVALLVCLV